MSLPRKSLVSMLDTVSNELLHRSRFSHPAEAVHGSEDDARKLVQQATRLLAKLDNEEQTS